MTTVNSFKPLGQAIMDGEQTVKVETPRFLAACAVAEKCSGIPERIKSFLDLLLKKQSREKRLIPISITLSSVTKAEYFKSA